MRTSMSFSGSRLDTSIESAVMLARRSRTGVSTFCSGIGVSFRQYRRPQLGSAHGPLSTYWRSRRAPSVVPCLGVAAVVRVPTPPVEDDGRWLIAHPVDAGASDAALLP